MAPQRRQPTPLIGRGGVQVVAGDALIGFLALPLAALIREVLSTLGSPLGVPENGFKEIDRLALWIVAALSTLLWPLALRSVDAGYPSTHIPLRRFVAAIALWLLAGSGAIYLLDKDLASRALVLFAAGIGGGLSITIRAIGRRTATQPTVPRTELPLLSGEAERALTRGEPIAVSIDRLERALPRPTIILEGGTIWIYPSALSPAERLIKRLVDVIFAGALLTLLSPLILLVSLAVLIRDGRPIFYSDRRAGLFGRPIVIRKFRTMKVGADLERASLWAQNETRGPAFKIAADPRVTPLGRLLRKYSLDELPQLFDVLRGRLSLVGPRPAGLDELDRYEDRHRMRLTVRPGVTGLWQVRRRLDDDFEQRVSDDIEYIQRWSVAFDIEVILRTIRVVLAGRGV